MPLAVVVLLLQEKYKYMDPGLRQRLRAELERHQPDYSLDDVRDPHRPIDSYMHATHSRCWQGTDRQAGSIQPSTTTQLFDLPHTVAMCRWPASLVCAGVLPVVRALLRLPQPGQRLRPRLQVTTTTSMP